MMPLRQTSAHYPEMSKQNDRSLSNGSFRTLSASPIQECADCTTVLPSAMTHDTDHDQSATPLMTDATGTDQSKTPPSPDQKQTALTTLGIIVTAILLIVQGNQTRHGTTNQVSDKAMTSRSAKKLMQRTTQNAECPRYEHWTQEEPQYKSPPRNTTSSPSKLPDFSPMPTAPNNTPTTSPCLPPSLTPPLQLRSEDSGSKEKSTTIPGKAMTSSTHGGAMMTAVIPGTVAKRWAATKIMLRTKTTILGTPVQQWEVAKVALPVILMTSPTPPIMMLMTKTTSYERGRTSPHHGMSPLDKNMRNSITSSPILSANDSPTTPHLECLGNANPSMTSHVSASTCAWMVLHNDSLGRSRPWISTTQTWKNYSGTWNGTYVRRQPSTHSTKAVALKSPIPLSMNKGPKSLGPYPANGNDEANDTGQQQRPSTYARGKKLLPSTCSYSKMTGSPPPRFTTCNGDNTSRNLKTPSGGKYSDKTMHCTTKSSTLRDTRTRTKGSTLDTWKHPPKKGMNIASRHHFSILSLSLTSHHLTDYLTYHLTRAPALVPHDQGARDHSHNPVTNHLILAIDFSCDQACDLSHDTM